MEDLKKIDYNILIDMLSKCVKDYMRMFKEGSLDEEYARCKKMIEQITQEVDSRKQKKLGLNNVLAKKDLN